MNLWLVKLGRDALPSSIASDMKNLSRHWHTLANGQVEEWQNGAMHYICVNQFAEGCYNDLGAERLSSFSGLLIDRCGLRDLRDIKNVPADCFVDPEANLLGNYALMQASSQEEHFQCRIDPAGLYRVYVHQAESQTVYVSNSLHCIHLIKKEKPDIDVLATKIVTGETFGLATEDAEVRILPEYGDLTWVKGVLTLGRYKPLADLVQPSESTEVLLDQLERDFKQYATYLHKYFKIILPLSGGFDSRLALHAFQHSSFESIRSYTFNSGRTNRDVKIARKIARFYDLKHEVIEVPVSIPLPPMRAFIEANAKDLQGTQGLGAILSQALEAQVAPYFDDPAQVLISGNGCGAGFLFPIYGIDATFTPEMISSHILRRSCMRPEAVVRLHGKISSYLQEKYGSFPARELGDLYFYFERFRNSSGGNALNSCSRKSFYFTPYATASWLKLSFATEPARKWKAWDGSIHHQLEQRLTARKPCKIEFTDYVIRDANAIDRISLAVKQLFMRGQRRFMNKKKMESELRLKFISENKWFIRETLRRHENSALFDTLDYNKIYAMIDDNKSLHQNFQLLNTLIPMLIHLETLEA